MPDPLVRVVVTRRSPRSFNSMLGMRIESLACGHELSVHPDTPLAKRRRCARCGREAEQTERALALTRGEVL